MLNIDKKIHSGALLLVVILGMYSCKTQNTSMQQVRFVYEEYYTLDATERELPLEPAIVQSYEAFNGLEEYNIPLNRFIKSAVYDVYIGIGVDKPMEELMAATLGDTSITLLERKQVDSKYDVLFYRKGGDLFVQKIIYKDKKASLPVFVSAVGKDSATIRKLFDDGTTIGKIK